ncbi:MAG TPA: hypothetical protein PKX25_10370 [Microthrixaceae bacterium]|jgi:hypothetical protein|nr:hypothetical protein [Acidimicrobiales bacterium]MCB9376690.1 hypothetical protein [Microthrixaceae bacterium]MCZ7537386.1 hypothetical protein [Acidimicrobiia bacterium]MCB9402498.1 hypothetical protein [Microthrixaceae bacterium]HMU78682.1 hypothetical protein [Microthrixaceae bacterium]
MPWFGHPPRRAVISALCVALVLALAGCSDDDSDTAASSTTAADRTSTTASTSSTSRDTTTTTTEATPVTTAPGTTAEQEVIDRYVGYWNARFNANAGVPNPDDPALRDFATGRQLDAVVAETQSNLDSGVAFERAAEPHNIQRVTVVEIDGDRAVVQECVVDDGLVVSRDTGEVVDDSVSTHNVQAEMLRVDGVWKVSEARLLQQFEGVAGCALAS